MPQKITWTTEADAAIAVLRAAGATWDRVAASLGVSRNAALERARALRGGATTIALPARVERPERIAEQDTGRPPLPPGHPVAWGVLVENTCLEGTAYPAPDFSDRALRRLARHPASEGVPALADLSREASAHGACRPDRTGGGLRTISSGVESLENI